MSFLHDAPLYSQSERQLSLFSKLESLHRHKLKLRNVCFMSLSWL